MSRAKAPRPARPGRPGAPGRGVRLTVVWEFTGQPSAEAALRVAEEWAAGHLGGRIVPASVAAEPITAPLRARREALGLTLDELADHAGVHATSVRQAELGGASPSSRSHQAVADALAELEARR